jgi:hypothetical protein
MKRSSKDFENYEVAEHEQRTWKTPLSYEHGLKDSKKLSKNKTRPEGKLMSNGTMYEEFHKRALTVHQRFI